MAATIKETDDESLRKKCENASLEDASEASKKTSQPGVLPPIRLGMSFSDWKQMKEAEEAKKSPSSPKGKQFTSQLRQHQRLIDTNKNQHFNNNTQIFRSQQQNLPNFNYFNPPNQTQNLPNFMAQNHQQIWQNYNSTIQNENQRNSQNHFYLESMNSPKIPPLKPPMSFDDFLHQDQYWSSGPLMQPMFPPMPKMPKMPYLNQQSNPNNKSNHDNSNRLISQNRPSARVKPKSVQSQSMQPLNTNSNAEGEDNTNPLQSSTTQPQIFIQRPRNSMNKNEKYKSNWIVKPQVPPAMHATTPEAREEKQRMWREYRLAMKPFKHREFANAKRVVQRLGKKSLEELDEKDRARLDRAMEYVNAHKAMLNARMMDRSNRVEKSLQNDKTTICDESTNENVIYPPPGWSTKKDAWNKDSTRHGVQQSYGPLQMEDNISGGDLNTAAGSNAIPFITS